MPETPNEIIVVLDTPGIFRVALGRLNPNGRQSGDVDEFLGPRLPLELANQYALAEGARLNLPVTIYAAENTDRLE